ncbi:MAG TPA: hypothetical protein VK742_18240 [Candidatus Sulfotelmatobacter sp.]|nr:hypothetical protein [Candidatus Sulfotelmatobacter sp.]
MEFHRLSFRDGAHRGIVSVRQPIRRTPGKGAGHDLHHFCGQHLCDGLRGVYGKARAARVGICRHVAVCRGRRRDCFGIWVESNSDVYWKTTGTLIVLATAFTHALLMQIPVLKPAHRWTQVAAAILVAVLSLEIIYVIVSSSFEHDTDTIFRLIAATSVFVVLLTLVIPICAKLGANRKANDERLVLEKISDDTFADSSGRKYRVTAIGNE